MKADERQAGAGEGKGGAASAVGDQTEGRTVETDVPARLDRLPWSGWHMRIITALGTSWLLDGLEVTLVGSLAGILESRSGLGLTDPQVSGAATTYLAGAVLGALLMLGASGCEMVIGVEAAGKSLESISKPLQSR